MHLKDSLVHPGDLKKRTQSPTQVVQRLPRLIPLPQPITLTHPLRWRRATAIWRESNRAQPPRSRAAEVKMKPHGPLSERFMRHHYGASGFVKKGAAISAVRVEPAAGAV
jgi:hypothetical protein